MAGLRVLLRFLPLTLHGGRPSTADKTAPLAVGVAYDPLLGRCAPTCCEQGGASSAAATERLPAPAEPDAHTASTAAGADSSPNGSGSISGGGARQLSCAASVRARGGLQPHDVKVQATGGRGALADIAVSGAHCSVCPHGNFALCGGACAYRTKPPYPSLAQSCLLPCH